MKRLQGKVLRLIVIAVLGLITVISLHAQDVRCPAGFVCISQTAANTASQLVDRLKAANDLTASQAELITALQNEIKDLKGAVAAHATLDAVNDRIQVTEAQWRTLATDMMKLQADIIDRLHKQLTGGKTKTQRFLEAVKVLYYIVAGGAIIAGL